MTLINDAIAQLYIFFIYGTKWDIKKKMYIKTYYIKKLLWLIWFCENLLYDWGTVLLIISYDSLGIIVNYLLR